MFDWTDDPITKLDFYCAVGFIVLCIFGALAGHREKIEKWLPDLLRRILRERGED